jgi:hypothetical protein
LPPVLDPDDLVDLMPIPEEALLVIEMAEDEETIEEILEKQALAQNENTQENEHSVAAN